MQKWRFVAAAAWLMAGCSGGVEAICDDALRAFYRCGGAPQYGDLDACIDRYESAPIGCDRAFEDRLDCTAGVACSDEDDVCYEALSYESDRCGGDPIVPPY